MTGEEANALERFINDHDTRYQAKAMSDDEKYWVLLTSPTDGTQLDPIDEVQQYGERHIEPADPGPTIRGAWDKWLASRT
jgi:hypothetical protein